jgi:hypothetical protein
MASNGENREHAIIIAIIIGERIHPDRAVRGKSILKKLARRIDNSQHQ